MLHLVGNLFIKLNLIIFLVVTDKAFLCFTSSPLSNGRHELPANMEVFLRPIALVNIDRIAILQVLLKASGISSKTIVSSIVQQAETCEALLSTMRKLGMKILFMHFR